MTIAPSFLEELMSTIESDDKIGAVAGIYLQETDKDYHKEQHFNQSVYEKFGKDLEVLPKDFRNIPEFAGSIDFIAPYQQWFRHPDTELQEVEHLYSTYIYRRQAVIDVGYFPEDLSAICFREDTDTTFRLKMEGYKLFVNPRAIGYHYKAKEGGIRGKKCSWCFTNDRHKFEKKLKIWKQTGKRWF